MVDLSKHRKSIRLKNYNYSHSSAYFVTLCAHQRQCLFGEVRGNSVDLSPVGKLVEKCWNEILQHFPLAGLDSFVVMPNHIHGILVIQGVRRGEACLAPTTIAKPRTKLSNIVGSFKSAVSKAVHEKNRIQSLPVWQRNFYEHVVRGESDMNKIREYIVNNPLQWALDEENPDCNKGEACLAPTKAPNEITKDLS